MHTRQGFRWGVIFVLITALAIVVAAQDDGTISPGTVIEGEAEGAVLPYNFEAEAGQSFVFSIESDFTALLTVEDAEGEVYVNNEDIRYTDLPMLFTAPSAGTYTLIVGTSFGEPEGAFTLEMADVEVQTVAYGDSVDLTPEESLYFYFDFEGSEGDVLNIYANSEDDDARLRLLLPNGTELASDDDNGPGGDPYIRRFILPNDGRYVVVLSPFSERRPLETPVTLNIEQTEILPVLAEMTTVVLGGESDGDTDIEVFVFDEVTAGDTYRLTVAAERLDTRVDIEIIQANETISSVRVADFSRTSLDFVAASGRPIFIVVDFANAFRDSRSFDVSLSPVE